MPHPEAFAREVRASVAAGEIAGAVAAVTTNQMLRVEAFGLRDQASESPMETDTIFRGGVHKIAWQNVCRFFEWDPFAVLPRDRARVGALRAEATDVDTTVRSRAEWVTLNTARIAG